MSALDNREWMKELIELYHSEPCLWNAKSKDYQDGKKKGAAYEKLVKKYSEVEPQADKEAVLNKIESLRSDYRKELQKVLTTRSELTGIETYEPELWYFPLMRFLDDQEYLENVNYPADSLETAPGGEPGTASNSASGISSSQRAADRNHNGTLAEENVLALEHEDDFQDIFGKMVAMKFRGMSEEQRILAEKLMDEVWNAAKCGKLTKLHTLVNTDTETMDTHECNGTNSPSSTTRLGSVMFHSLDSQQQQASTSVSQDGDIEVITEPCT